MKTIKHTERVYYTLSFLYWFGNALPLALLILLLQSRGLSLFQASMIFGINAIVVVLLEVPTGSLADLVGRKRVTIWAALLMFAGFGIFFVAFSFPVLLLGAAVYGASRALASGALDAWFVDTLQSFDSEIDLQPVFARGGVILLTGLGLGTLLGGAIPRWFAFLPAEGTAILTPFSMTLVASLIVQLVRLILVLVWVVEDRPKSTFSFSEAVATIPSFVGDAINLSRESNIIRWLLPVAFAGGFVMTGLENLWQPYFAALLGGSEGNSFSFGIIMAGNFLLGAVGNMLSPLVTKWLNDRHGLVAGLFEFLRGVMLLLLVMSGGIYAAGLFFWLVYFGTGVTGPSIGVMFNAEISAENRSTMLSIQSMVSYIGVFVGSLVLGYIADQFSIGTAWVVAGCVLLLSLLPYLKIDRLYTAKHGNHATQDPERPTLQETDAS